MNDPAKDVLIVGGGLAGLACAIRLHQAGARPVIFESSDGVGGRVRTDEVDGFLLDRGFQVFLDAYPEAGHLLDLKSLDLRKFKAGALIYQNSGMKRVMDVFREPRYLIESALAPVGSMADKLRVALLKWRLMRQGIEEIAGHDDMTTEPAGLETRILAELEEWFGSAVREWRHLRTYRIEQALPTQAVGSGFTRPGFRLEAGVYLCGDHLWSASIEGAIISGLRTADAILKRA